MAQATKFDVARADRMMLEQVSVRGWSLCRNSIGLTSALQLKPVPVSDAGSPFNQPCATCFSNYARYMHERYEEAANNKDFRSIWGLEQTAAESEDAPDKIDPSTWHYMPNAVIRFCDSMLSREEFADAPHDHRVCSLMMKTVLNIR